MISIQTFGEEYQHRIIDFILDIQQNEFAVAVTIADQPDLLDIPGAYGRGKGNFWIALDENKLVGTIALIDIGNRQSALRKMFVHRDYRGQPHRAGQLLLNTVLAWCNKEGIDEIYLGTIDRMFAAHRFYEKNGFRQMDKTALPESFPLMPVDNMFFGLHIQNGTRPLS
jgi:GNAT superfamily N-acetyltransferase